MEIRDELWGSVCKVLFGLLYCQKDYIISFKYFMSFFHITIESIYIIVVRHVLLYHWLLIHHISGVCRSNGVRNSPRVS